jgi:predicted dehydrogenase
MIQNVDVVYIGTPHTFHHANAKEALQAGKHVLCEKPVTFDMEELEELLAIAKEKNLFFMEYVRVLLSLWPPRRCRA